MAKIPNTLINKWVKISYKINPQIRSGGNPQYEMKMAIKGAWGWTDVYNSYSKDNKFTRPEVDAVFDFMKWGRQLVRTPNLVGLIDSEGMMCLAESLVSEFNKTR